MVKCSVVGCRNNSIVKRPGISFHKFPKNLKLRMKWLNAINRPDFKPTNGNKICSYLFAENDINYTLNLPRIKDGPFLHIPNLPPGQQARQPLKEMNLNLCPKTNNDDVQDIALPSTSQSGTPTVQLYKSNLNLFPGINNMMMFLKLQDK